MTQANRPSNKSVIGQPVDRVDGRAKVTGGARYAAEFPVNNIVHAVFITSMIAKGTIQSIDTQVAEKMLGVLKILTHRNIPKLAQIPKFTPNSTGMSFAPMQGNEIHYSGQPIGIVIAETLEQATDAAQQVQVSYQSQPSIATMHQALDQAYQPNSIMGGGIPGYTKRGNPVQALAEAPVQIKETYTIANNHHNPMEPCAAIAFWEGDQLTLNASTQGVTRTQTNVANMLGIPKASVRVVSPFVGGGFGCKSVDFTHDVFAAIAARSVRRPVKLVVTREQMYTAVGYREEQTLQLNIGATRDGHLTAISHTKTSPTSPFDDWAEPSGKAIEMFYQCPNFEATYKLVRVNTMTPTFMRAPGETPGMYALECAMDELAYKLNIDPIELRLRNHANVDPSTGYSWSSKSLKQCYARGAELFGWSRRNPQPRSMREGRYLVGIGMASATYPVYPPGSTSVRERLFADGRVLVQSGTQDIGTGTYTIATQVAADVLGVPIERVRFELGDTTLPVAPNSGGATTASTVSSGVYTVAQALRRQVLQLAIQDPASPLHNATEGAIAVENGRLFLKDNSARGETYSTLLTRLKRSQVDAIGTWQPGIQGSASQAENPAGRRQNQGEKKYSSHSFGAKFCEVQIDPDLGRLRVTRLLGIQAAGRILNPKTARSQIIGGMIMGVGQALMEDTHIDEHFARYTNANLGEYHIPVQADIPDIQVEFIDEEDPHINVLGVKGVGELAIVGTSAAIANAIYHATGKRIRDLPITPNKLL